MKRTTLIKCIGLLQVACIATSLATAQSPNVDSTRYTISPIAVNTESAEWGAFSYNGAIVFTSNRTNLRLSHLIHRTDKQTGADFYTLYSAPFDTSGKVEKTKLFADELDNRFNVGPAYITPDGNTLIITHNVERKKGTTKTLGQRSYMLQLQFYTRDIKRGRWEKPVDFQYNSSKYSCAHAAMSSDGQLLYFSSDMPGTLGGMDIFVCRREETGWSTPQNMGKQVNSEQNEIFPSISEDGKTLYFSSNRSGGLGGLDVYRVALPLVATSAAQNMGTPINSPYDDFGLVLYYGSKYGFLSSNRPLNISNRTDTSDNIYRLQAFLPTKMHNITVSDSLPKVPEPNSSQTQSDDMQIVAMVNKATLPHPQKVTLSAEVLFNFDMYDLTPQAKKILDKLSRALLQQPDVTVLLSGHTDSRGSAEYNRKLSLRRVQSVQIYLIKKGVKADRITIKAYGASQLINKCAKGVSCTEAEHRENRRVEFLFSRTQESPKK